MARLKARLVRPIARVGKAGCQCVRRLHQCRRRHNLVDEAKPERFLRADAVAREGKFRRLRIADEHWQKHCPTTIRHQPDLDERLYE